MKAGLAMIVLGFALLAAALAVEARALSPHWYLSSETSEEIVALPQGEPWPINFGAGPKKTITVRSPFAGTVACASIDADATVINPAGKGWPAGTWTLESFAAAECSQTGFCAPGEPVTLRITNLPVTGVLHYGFHGYRFSSVTFNYRVTCTSRATTFSSEPLEMYWSNGGESAAQPPNLDCEYGGHYGETYGDCRYDPLFPSLLIRSELEWGFLGYGAREGAIVTSS